MSGGWLNLGQGWLFEHIRDAIAVVEAHSGLIRLWNPAAEHLFEYPASDSLGQPISALIPGLDTSQTPREGAQHTLELRGRRISGNEFPIEVTLSRVGPPDEPHRFALLVIRDITERRRAEAQQRLQLALATERFLDGASRQLTRTLDLETTLHTLPRLVVPRLADVCIVDVLGEGGAIERVSAAHVDLQHAGTLEAFRQRYAPSETRQWIVKSDVPIDGPARLVNDTHEVDWSGIAPDAEHLALLNTLGIRSLIRAPLLGRGGVLGLMLFGSNVPNRYTSEDLATADELAHRCALALDNAQLYRTAQQAIAARDQFLSIAAHELRAPLTRLKTHAEVLLLAHTQNQLEPGRLLWSIERINAAADRLAALTKDLLDVSRLREGQLPFRPAALDLAELIRELEPRLVDQISDSHRLLVETTTAPCPVLVDQDRLEQIITNLLDNAVKYSPDGGEVYLTVRCDNDGVELEVRDRGLGLPAGADEIIFEAFGRASNAEQQNVPGMGLGLHICRVLVERHGGRITAHSEGEHQGTTVTVWLPFADSAPAPISDTQQRLTNQLTVAIGYCELLSTNPQLPPELREQAREAMRGAQEAASLLESLQKRVP